MELLPSHQSHARVDTAPFLFVDSRLLRDMSCGCISSITEVKIARVATSIYVSVTPHKLDSYDTFSLGMAAVQCTLGGDVQREQQHAVPCR